MIKLKKLVALAIAMVMVICAMNFGAFAATGHVSADTKIVVTGLTDGDMAHFYRVIEWEMADATHTGGWVYTPAFSGMKHADYTEIPVSEITGNPAKNIPMGITSEIAGIIARKADPTKAVDVPVTGGKRN